MDFIVTSIYNHRFFILSPQHLCIIRTSSVVVVTGQNNDKYDAGLPRATVTHWPIGLVFWRVFTRTIAIFVIERVFSHI